MMDDRHDFTAPDLSQLVGSRLCHDIVNPLSAISNGIELLALSGAPRSPEIDLIASAVGDAMARVRFYRIAFGAARAGETLSPRELREILTALYSSGRHDVDWQITSDLPRRDAKLAFLMLSCAETAFPLGASLQVTNADGVWRLTGAGRKLASDDALWGLLHGSGLPVEAPPPGRVQFALLAQEMAARGLMARVAMDEDSAHLTLSVAPA